jgi:hypothetical protein
MHRLRAEVFTTEVVNATSLDSEATHRSEFQL